MIMPIGFAAAEKALNEAKSSGQGYAGKLFYATWKDGETKILRFLTDDVITCDFYEYVVDNQGKTQNFIVAPSLHSDEDGNVDPNWHGQDWVLKYGGKMREKGLSGDLIDPVPRKRTVALAVLQEEAPRENASGRMAMSYQDVLSEITVKDKPYAAREFVIVKQAYKNFWVQLVGYFHEYGTICDRPYKITRRGGDKDTQYQIIPLTPDSDFDIRELQESYGYGPGHKRADDDPDRFLYCPEHLEDWAERYGGEERVKFFLADPKEQARQARAASGNGGNYTPSGNDEYAKETTSNPSPEEDEAQAAPPPSTLDMSSLRSRLERHRK
jgi:hypothetical protein